VLLLNNDDVAKVLRTPDVVRVLEASYRDLSEKRAVCRPRMDLRFPVEGSEQVYQWGTMEGGSLGSGYMAIRMKSDVLTEVESDGVRTQEKYCVRPGLYCGLVLLFSIRTGEPLALINDGVLQHMRVGADSAIGTKYAAREGAHVLGMLGSGGMARSHLEAVLEVRPVDLVRVYSPTRENRERYAREMSALHGIEVVPVATPREVYSGADLVAGCTDSANAVIVGDWLEPGTHVTCVGGRMDPAAYDRFDVWLRLGTAPAPRTHPEWRPEEEYVVWTALPDDPVWARHTHGADRKRQAPTTARRVLLEELLAGQAPARTDDDQITFSERGNIQGAQFFAVAGLVFEQARELGLGRHLPQEWFLQDIRD